MQEESQSRILSRFDPVVRQIIFLHKYNDIKEILTSRFQLQEPWNSSYAIVVLSFRYSTVWKNATVPIVS